MVDIPDFGVIDMLFCPVVFKTGKEKENIDNALTKKSYGKAAITFLL